MNEQAKTPGVGWRAVRSSKPIVAEKARAGLPNTATKVDGLTNHTTYGKLRLRGIPYLLTKATMGVRGDFDDRGCFCRICPVKAI